MKKYTIYIPESFNPNEYSYGEQIGYLTHIIQYSYLTNAKYEPGDPVPIHYKTAMNIIGKNSIKQTFQDAINYYILFTNNSFNPKAHKSKTYTLHQSYLSEPVKPYSLTNYQMKRNLKKWYEQSSKNSNEKPIHKHLKKFLYKLDWSEIGNLTDDELWRLSDNDPNKYKYFKWYIKNIKHKDLFHQPGKETNRYYTTLTNLKRELRPLVKYDGQPIKYIDIANSQPLLLSSLLKKTINDWTIRKEGYSNSIIEEINIFTKRCEDGLFYDNAMKYINSDRDKIKINLLQVFFDRDRTTQSCKYTRYLHNEYPEIMRWATNKKKKEGSKILAILLQQHEADLIINKACRTIYKKDKNIPLFTIHDSIGTTPEYYPLIKQTLKTVYENENINPTFKEE